MPTTSRSFWLSLTALVLAFDGLAALLLSGASLLFMNLSVAAIEGRSGNPNSQLIWWVVGLFVLAVVAFVAAWQAARRIRTGRVLGTLVAAAVAIAAGWGLLAIVGAPPLDLGGVALGAAVLMAQVLVLVTLFNWKPAEE